MCDCPRCKAALKDVRASEDRIDYWCNGCELGFTQTSDNLISLFKDKI